MPLNSDSKKHVIVCIPYYKCQQYIRRAVLSILNQTHKNLTLVVVNDADFETPPWPMLADIDDPRLVRFDLKENNGPYFAIEVVLRAIQAPYFLTQDADDWSHPMRIEHLLNLLLTHKSIYATSSQPQVINARDGKAKISEIRFSTDNKEVYPIRFIPDLSLSSSFKYRIPHIGLYRTSAINILGGYYGGFRIAYDTLLGNLILMLGKVSHTNEKLYYRYVRVDSLTHSSETGIISDYAAVENKKILNLYNNCFNSYSKWLQKEISGSHFTQELKLRSKAYLRNELKIKLDSEVKIIKSIIQ